MSTTASSGGSGRRAAGRGSPREDDQGTTALQDQAQERARALADQAREHAREQVDQRSTDLAQRVNSTAQDFRGVAEHLRSQGKEQPARVAEQAAERAATAAAYLEQADSDRILHDVEALARKRPWAVVAGGAALGLVASRLLKASSRERYRGQAAEGTLPQSYPSATRATAPRIGHASTPEVAPGSQSGGGA